MADPTAPPITIAQIKVKLGVSQYARLTDNNQDAVATNAINESRIWVKSKWDKSGLDFDETDVMTAESVVTYACYLLFYRNNQVKAGNHYKKMAKDLLKSVLGNDALEDDVRDLPSLPAATVEAGDNWVFGDTYGNGSYSPYNRY